MEVILATEKNGTIESPSVDLKQIDKIIMY